jgi:hypothetical protein
MLCAIATIAIMPFGALTLATTNACLIPVRSINDDEGRTLSPDARSAFGHDPIVICAAG